MDTKQTLEEINQNWAVVTKSLLPAVLPDTTSNVTLIYNCAAQRFRGPDGLIDLSPANLGKCISLCVNALQWTIPPPPKPKAKPPQEVQGATAATYRKSESALRGEWSREQEEIQRRELTAAAETAEEIAVAENLELCKVLCESSARSSRRFHHKTARLRESLREVFKKGRKLHMTRESSEALYNQLLAHCDQFPD